MFSHFSTNSDTKLNVTLKRSLQYKKELFTNSFYKLFFCHFVWLYDFMSLNLVWLRVTCIITVKQIRVCHQLCHLKKMWKSAGKNCLHNCIKWFINLKFQHNISVICIFNILWDLLLQKRRFQSSRNRFDQFFGHICRNFFPHLLNAHF